MAQTLDISRWRPRPGALVKATRPITDQLPAEDTRKLGTVIGILPPYTGHQWATPHWVVAWTGPGTREFITIEPDHRIEEIGTCSAP